MPGLQAGAPVATAFARCTIASCSCKPASPNLYITAAPRADDGWGLRPKTTPWRDARHPPRARARDAAPFSAPRRTIRAKRSAGAGWAVSICIQLCRVRVLLPPPRAGLIGFWKNACQCAKRDESSERASSGGEKLGETGSAGILLSACRGVWMRRAGEFVGISYIFQAISSCAT